jgi:hypothetical protein
MKSRKRPEQRDVEQSESASFKGNLGKTQTEHVHITAADGSIRSVEVYRVVNVATHPELRDRVRSGDLHRLEDGHDLALSFVYHDPEARKFALVIPIVLGHLELKERAKLMNALAEDSTHEVPRYVRECTTVIGLEALEVFLGESSSSKLEDFSKLSVKQKARYLDESEREFKQRERALAERERDIAAMAEAIAARDEKSRKREQQLDARQRDLTLREQQLGQRLVQRAERYSPYQPLASDGEWREVSSFPPQSVRIQPVDELAFIDHSLERVVRDDEFVELDSPTPFSEEQKRDANRSITRNSGPPPLKLRAGISPPPLVRRDFSNPPYDYSDGQSRSVAPVLNGGEAVPPPLPNSRTESDDACTVTDSDVIRVVSPEVEPPSHFLSSEDLQIAVVLDQQLWLFVRVEDVHIYSYRRSLELLIQYCEYHEYPMVFLTLVTERKEEFWIRRAILDPYREGDREIIEALARSFAANVALYVGGEYLQTLRVAAPREAIAKQILERVVEASAEGESEISSADARELAFEEPPPVFSQELPFGPRRRGTATLTLTATEVDRLISWMPPDKMRQAALTYSIPQQVIDTSMKRMLGEAVKFGIALPDELRAKAVAMGLADDQADLIDKQIKSFALGVQQADPAFNREAISANWSKLIDLADRFEVAVNDATRRLARASIIPGATRSIELPPYHSLSTEQLRDRLKQSDLDSDVVRELCRRRDPALLKEIFQSFVRMRTEDLFRAMPDVVRFKDEAVGELINTLSSDHIDLRHASALALGRLKPRRAIAPLIKQLQREKTNIWSEIARSIGDYGGDALKQVVQALRTSEGTDQRFVVTFAHLVNNGCSQQIGKLEKDTNGRIASAARKATAQYSRVKWEDQSIRENRPLNNQSTTLKNSQVFFAELAELQVKFK